MTTTIASAAEIERQLLDQYHFSVDKFPLRGPDGLATPHYGLFRSDNGACVGPAVSAKYTPHTTEDVIALATAAAGAFGEDGGIQVRATWHDGHVVTIAPSDEYRRQVYGTDTVWPRLIVHAGYDAKPFAASLGVYRDACRNLMIVRSAGATTGDKIKHTFCLRGRIDDLVYRFRRLAGSWDIVAQTIQALDAEQVNLAEFIKSVYPLAEDATRTQRGISERRVEAIVRRVVRERSQTGREPIRFAGGSAEVSAWEAFNGVQGYVQHDMPRRGKPDQFIRALVALRDPAVERAHNLALATLAG